VFHGRNLCGDGENQYNGTYEDEDQLSRTDAIGSVATHYTFGSAGLPAPQGNHDILLEQQLYVYLPQIIIKPPRPQSNRDEPFCSIT